MDLGVGQYMIQPMTETKDIYIHAADMPDAKCVFI